MRAERLPIHPSEQREQPTRGRIILLPGKGVLKMGTKALGMAAAIEYRPGDHFVVSGGYTNAKNPQFAESTNIEAIVRLFDHTLPSGIFHHNKNARNSWGNIEDSKPEVDRLMEELDASEVTVIATRHHGPRFLKLCQELGMTYPISLITIESTLVRYSPQTREFLRRYQRSSEYLKEIVTEPIWRIYHKIDPKDRLPKAVSQRRGNQ